MNQLALVQGVCSQEVLVLVYLFDKPVLCGHKAMRALCRSLDLSRKGDHEAEKAFNLFAQMTLVRG